LGKTLLHHTGRHLWVVATFHTGHIALGADLFIRPWYVRFNLDLIFVSFEITFEKE
jgi:hypothetical protein